MANRDKILDGLAWAGISEQARVAKIAAILVRESRVTKTRLKEAVRDTSPPYGRGKAICKLVDTEHQRQQAIYDVRQAQQRNYRIEATHREAPKTRLNNAYAYAFKRPRFDNRGRNLPEAYWNWDYETRQEWDEKEDARDKGDQCDALLHWGNAIVALVPYTNGDRHENIITRDQNGVIVRTYLRSDPDDLVQAAILLGGPKVRAALTLGIRVTTHWVARKSTIHYTNKPELVLPWRAARYEERENRNGWNSTVMIPTLIHSDGTITDDEVEVEEVPF
jgi:hypothetical protein